MGLDVRWKLGGMWSVLQILFLPLGIFDSYASLIQNKIFFDTIRRISNLTNLAVTSWAFSCLLSPGFYGSGKAGNGLTVTLSYWLPPCPPQKDDPEMTSVTVSRTGLPPGGEKRSYFEHTVNHAAVPV